MRRSAIYPLLLLAAALSASPVAAQVLFAEDFESYAPDSYLEGQGGWSGYGEASEQARAVVRPGIGHGGSQGLEIAAADGPFRSDTYGMERHIGTPETGVYWVQLRFNPPSASAWAADVRLRLGPTEVASGPGESVATWRNGWWRIHRAVEPEPNRWSTLTLRVDADRDVYSSWLDGVVLGEGLPLLQQGAAGLYLGGAGSSGAPLVIDDLVVTAEAPAGFSPRALFPDPAEDLLFRFAALGDPQPGLNSYTQNMAQLHATVDQVGWAGAALTVVLGDMVHDENDVYAYVDVEEALDRLDEAPGHVGWYSVRGNHDRRDLYRQHFHDALDYAVAYGGVRFVMLDAVGPADVDPPSGTYEGLSADQLAWVRDQFIAATAEGQEIILATHVSPWQDNPMGASAYYRIGPGRDDLTALIEDYDVTLVLSGHYHRALWHQEVNGTDYLVVPGSALARQGALSWALVEVYPDRLEVYNKPLFAAYEDTAVEEFYNSAVREWTSYADQAQETPAIAQGPITIERHHPARPTPTEPAETAGLALEQNRPNPVEHATEIAFALPQAADVRLAVYDALGREVARPLDGPMPGGAHRVRWERGDLASGVYLYRLTAGGRSVTRQMVVLR